MALLVGAATWPARLLPLNGVCGGEAILVTADRAEVLKLTPAGRLVASPAPGLATAAASLAGRQFLCAAGAALELSPDVAPEGLAEFDGPVRDAAPVGERLALLVGGRFVRGELLGARVALWHPGTGEVRVARQVKSEWNPCFLRPSPDRSRLLIGVRKTAHFDPVFRLRPFLYRPVANRLEPVWRGTSFALPFVDAVLADLAPEAGPEAVALEACGAGQRRVVVYAWSGTTMEAVALSGPGRLGQTLQHLGPHTPGLFAQVAAGWGLMALRLTGASVTSGLCRLQMLPVSASRVQAPAAWTVVPAHGRAWLVTCERSGELRATALSSVLP